MRGNCKVVVMRGGRDCDLTTKTVWTVLMIRKGSLIVENLIVR